MNGDTHEKQTNACLLQTDTPSVPVPPALSYVVRQQPAGQPANDVLAQLDRILAATPEGHYLCPPLKRSQVAAAADEIRTLRQLMMTVTSPGKTQTVAELRATMDDETHTDVQDLES